MFSEID